MLTLQEINEIPFLEESPKERLAVFDILWALERGIDLETVRHGHDPLVWESALSLIESVDSSNRTKPQGLFNLWNEKVGHLLPRVEAKTGKRVSAAKRLLKKVDMEEIERRIEILLLTPFCLGKNDRDWRASIDYFLREDTQAKIVERLPPFNKVKLRPVENVDQMHDAFEAFRETL